MGKEIKSVCVFCGANNAAPQDYLDEGTKLGHLLAAKGLNLVYGAGASGIMGTVADGVLEKGGTVTGVYPRVLEGLEEEHKKLTETIIVDDMHTRKMTMFDKSDAFIIMPGGFGTMDETFEVITWKQLHTHNKPIVLYNYKGYWDKWEALTEQFMELGFAGKHTRSMYEIVDDLEESVAILPRLV